MERVYQMHVVPDLLPHFHPSFDLRVSYPHVIEKPQGEKVFVPEWYRLVEPGVFLTSEQVSFPSPLLSPLLPLAGKECKKMERGEVFGVGMVD